MSNPKKGTAAAAIAEAEEAGPEMVTLEWRGAAFTIPAEVEDWSAAAVEAFEAGHAMTACHNVLGDEQWARAKKVGRGTVREIGELFDAIAKAAGFEDAGE